MTPTLTYYRNRDPTVSFHLVARHHIVWLRRLGVNVVECDLDFRPEQLRRSEPSTPLAIVHTLFDFYSWGDLSFDQVVAGLRRRHRTLLGMEVADTTRISPRFASWANHPGVDGIMLPSKYSIDTFRASGVTNALQCVPHGVLTTQPSSRFDFLRVDDRPKALFFATRWGHRKGWDLLGDLIPEFDECLFVVKTFEEPHPFDAAPNVLPVSGWLSDEDLASLYCNCDFLISLHRGGAFELNCAEAAGYGLPVVATRTGGVTDYLPPEHLIDAGGSPPLPETGTDHCGSGATPDPARAKEVIAGLLAELPAAQRRARRHVRRLRKELSWEKATRTILAFASARSNARS